jgi:hypothetical protein
VKSLGQQTVPKPSRTKRKNDWSDTEHAPVASGERRRMEGVTSHREIERRAYEIYLAHGETHGHELEDWLQADRELKSGSAFGHPGIPPGGPRVQKKEWERLTRPPAASGSHFLTGS